MADDATQGNTTTQTDAEVTPEVAPAATEAKAVEATPAVATEVGASLADAAKVEGDKGTGLTAAAKEASGEAPVAYEAFNVPEGFDTLDEGMMKEFGPMAQELGLGQEGAQKLIDFHAAQSNAQLEQMDKEVKAQEDTWRTEFAKDKDYNARVQMAGKGLDTLAPELGKALADMHMQWHPAVISMLETIGKSVSEGRVLNGGAAPAASSNGIYNKMAEHKARNGIV